jgi:hypothetical protein
MVEFFRTSDGRLHYARIGGALYVIGLPWACNFHLMQPRCGATIVFVAGWWLSFCDKRGVHNTLSSLLATPVRITGIVMVMAGLAGIWYFTHYH